MTHILLASPRRVSIQVDMSHIQSITAHLKLTQSREINHTAFKDYRAKPLLSTFDIASATVKSSPRILYSLFQFFPYHDC